MIIFFFFEYPFFCICAFIKAARFPFFFPFNHESTHISFFCFFFFNIFVLRVYLLLYLRLFFISNTGSFYFTMYVYMSVCSRTHILLTIFALPLLHFFLSSFLSISVSFPLFCFFLFVSLGFFYLQFPFTLSFSFFVCFLVF